MITRSLTLFIMAVLANSVQAGTAGSWTQESYGGKVSVGRQELKSQPLQPSGIIPTKATVTRIYWKISLLTPQPQGLKIRLCHSRRCESLKTLSGEFTPKLPWHADDTYYFTYTVNTKGQLKPSLHILKNTLTLNYKTN